MIVLFIINQYHYRANRYCIAHHLSHIEIVASFALLNLNVAKSWVVTCVIRASPL